MIVHRLAGAKPHDPVRVYPDVGERIPVIGCHSEVMMHFGLAGKPIEISLVSPHMTEGGPVGSWCAQVWKDGQKFSFPITTGEAGFYEHDQTRYFHNYYCFADPSRLPEED